MKLYFNFYEKYFQSFPNITIIAPPTILVKIVPHNEATISSLMRTLPSLRGSHELCFSQ